MRARVADARAWDAAAKNTPTATFFHTREWAEVFAKTFPENYRPAARLFEWPDQTAVLPAMQIYSEARGAFRTYYSNWPGVYGGLLDCGRPLSPERGAEAARVLMGAGTAGWTVFGSPFSDDAPLFSGWRMKKKFTHVVDLRPVRGEDDLLGLYSHTIHAKLKTAARAGFRIEPARDLRDIDGYYALYNQCLKRWGDKATNRYPRELFRNLFDLKSSNAVFWLLKRDDQLAGGSLNLYFNGHAVEWHGVYAEEFFRFGARAHLAHALALDALRRGCDRYDFNPSGGHAGTAAFKEFMGGKKLTFNSYSWDNKGLYQVFKRLKGRWRRAPRARPTGAAS